MGSRSRRAPSADPSQNDLWTGGPYLRPPGMDPSDPQQLVGNQEILERIATHGAPGSPVTRREGSMSFDGGPAPRDPTLRLDFLDGLPFGDAIGGAVGDWYRDPKGATKPTVSGADPRSQDCHSAVDCPDTSGAHVIGGPPKSF